ncbi:MAG TPA: NADH-quinone oxidoreductase subunit J [Dehalococcoidia bacterium]|nr:NADH-quinone oxidoreductase subunit J [Dehalococcoidia bacterium]
MDDVGIVIAFWALSVMTVGSALLVVLFRNLLHAVLSLIVSFAGMAGLFVTLSADFLAVSQVLIYVGAISILMIFAIMLTPEGGRRNTESRYLPAAVVGALGIVAAVMFVVFDVDWATPDREGFEETASLLGEALLDKWVLPFEIASAVLLAAMIGAIVLVRERGD